MGYPAIFLDRDGVINEERNYVYRIEDFKFIDGVFDACRSFKAMGYRLVIITNQAGVARGYYTEKDFHKLTEWMLNEFLQHRVEIDGVYYCPHHPVHGVGEYRSKCDCRKPEPGMLLRAAEELDIDLSSSVLTGDKLSDIAAAHSAGVGKSILVRTGHLLSDDAVRAPDATCDTLRQVVSILQMYAVAPSMNN